MKIFTIVAVAILLFISGCSKKEMGCTPVPPQAEESQILAYASANGITAVKHSSGIYYQIVDPGSGTTTPTLNSKIYLTYTGKFLNGAQFDQYTDSYTTGWKLGNMIEGWQIGIPLIKKGGKIKLIIPSSYGYGCNPVLQPNTDVVKIPGNSVLYFDVSLIDVQ